MESDLLTQLGTIILGATLLALLVRAVGIPSIVGYILAGLLLGPLLGLVELNEVLGLISEVGIVLLLFLVGLELSLDKIREVGRVALIAGGGQVIATGVLVAGIVGAFGRPPGEMLFLGIALTFSSTVVVVKLLDQIRALDRRHGRLAVGILLVQDLVVVLVLTIVSGLGSGESLTPGVLAADLAAAFGGTGLILALGVVAARWALPPLFRAVAGSQQTLLIWSLAWCFVLVFIAYRLELSLELGAFVAGVSLAQLPWNHDLRRRVHPLMNFFVAIFFVTLGLQMELAAALNAWPLVLALVLVTLIVKPPLVAHLLRWTGEQPPTALRSGVTLGQSSEFSFILGALAVGNGLVSPELLSIIGAVGLLTMGISSYAVINGEALVAALGRIGLVPWLAGRAPPDRPHVPVDPDQGQAGHVIVVGMNDMGRTLVTTLHERGVPTVAVDIDPAKLEGLPGRTVLGNAEYLSVLEEVELSRARLLVSALQIEDTNRLLAFRARTFGVPSAIHASHEEVENELQQLGVDHLMNSREAGLRAIATALHETGALSS